MEKQKERRKGGTIRPILSLKSKSLREMRKPNRKKSPNY